MVQKLLYYYLQLLKIIIHQGFGFLLVKPVKRRRMLVVLLKAKRDIIATL